MNRLEKLQQCLAIAQKHKNPDMEANIKLAIEASGYCQDGYMLLGRFAGKSTLKVRGECRDPATAQDRKSFKNTIQFW